MIKWGGGKLCFFVPLDPRGLFDCRGGKCCVFLSLSATVRLVFIFTLDCLVKKLATQLVEKLPNWQPFSR